MKYDTELCRVKLLEKLDHEPGWESEKLFITPDTYWYVQRMYHSSEASKRDIIMKSLTKRTSAKIKQILTILGKSYQDLFDIKPRNYLSFNVIGSPDSTDLDIVVYLNRDDDNRINSTDFVDLERIKKELQEAGYSETETQSSQLDINLVLIDDNGNVMATQKGDCSHTQNIIYYTHHFHRQKYNNVPVRQPISVDRFDSSQNIRIIAKFFLDNLKYLVLDKESYEILHNEKCNNYHTKGIRKRIDLSYRIYSQFISELSDSDNAWTSNRIDFMKSITMKLVQLILLHDHQKLEYNKLELARLISTLDDQGQYDFNEIEYFLSRGRRGHLSFPYTTFQRLMSRYCDIGMEFAEQNEKYTLRHCNDLTVDHIIESLTPMLNDENEYMILEFIESPREPTPGLLASLIERFDLNDNSSVNNLFQGSIRGTEILGDRFIQAHCELAPQRSNEWLRLLDHYRCGRNNGVIQFSPDENSEFPIIVQKLKFYWNLIRGCLGEIIVQHYYQRFSLIGIGEIIEVGLLVEEKRRNARAIAPDLILYNYREQALIPIEIKCLSGHFSENSAMRREISLARKQLNTSYEILNHGLQRGLFTGNYPITNIKKGIIALLWLDRGYHHLEVIIL